MYAIYIGYVVYYFKRASDGLQVGMEQWSSYLRRGSWFGEAGCSVETKKQSVSAISGSFDSSDGITGFLEAVARGNSTQK